jgi:hypothetical protein
VLQLEGIELTVHQEFRLLLYGDTVNKLHVGDEDHRVNKRNAHANHIDRLLDDFLLLCFNGLQSKQTEQATTYN